MHCPAKPDPAPRRDYLDRHRLAALVAEYQGTGTASDELGRALLAIAAGVWDRYQFGGEREDFGQACALHLLGRPCAGFQASGHAFNYLTTCAIRFGWKWRDKLLRERERFGIYAEALARVKPIPGDGDGD